jgi:Domain of Unknown Function with PDB structure (DUF3857)/Transglutaminase-like superfamily
MTGRLFLRALLAAILFIGLANSYALAGEDWKPIDPAHLAMKTPVVEPDAEAEAILWEVHVADERTYGEWRTVLTHYIRIKIFTERGKESQSHVDIPYFGNTSITDIAGRTIKPDGSIVELKKDAVFERTIVKVSGAKLKAKSFAMPAVEPGAIIEYRWKEVRGNHLSLYDRYQFQREIPVQFVKYYFKPLSLEGYNAPGLSMNVRMFNGRFEPFQKEKDGYSSTTLKNVPAFREEPHMPPEDQVRTWLLVYYTIEKQQPPDKFWPTYGREQYEEYKKKIKVNDDVKKAAATIIGEATTPEQKLERLYDFCRMKIKNISDDASGLTAADRAKLKANESPADTLKRGMGRSHEIDYLFAALATAAGFEARVVRIGDRSDTFFDPSFADDYMLTSYDIAVKVGNDWRFFDPGSTYVPFGMLRWQEEGQQALICDAKEPVFVSTPLSPPEKSLEKRTATLTLSEDGTVEGDVQIEYTGHLAVIKKEENDDDSPEQREQSLRDMLKGRMSTAEVSDIKIENVTDPTKPFIYRFHVIVPGYAQRTGKRLFLQPAFFEKGIPALFTASQRKQQLYFHYPWMETDTVTINLPKGFALDNPDKPAPFNASDLAKYEVNMKVIGKNEQLIYNRTWMFNALIFPQTSYAGVKKVFEALHESDNHTITFKQEVAAK